MYLLIQTVIIFVLGSTNIFIINKYLKFYSYVSHHVTIRKSVIQSYVKARTEIFSFYY